MHWLKKWRKQYVRKDGRKGIDKKEMAALVRNRDTGCSDVLIGIVENGGITHPEIARRIARITGATVEQYNSMVHKIHWGGYEPQKNRRRDDFEKKPQPLTIGVTPPNARAVVRLDMFGNIMDRHNSIMAAAAAAGCSVGAVENRCYRRLNYTSDEFKMLECTFRFEDEWNELSREERMKQLRPGQGRKEIDA